jgi:hypothetical protein
MKFRSLLGNLLLGLSGAIAGAAEAPSPARAQMDGFLAAFNSGDRAKIEAFGREHAPPDFVRPQILDDTMRMFQTAGGLDVVKIEESGPLALTSQVRERKTGTIVQLVIEVDPATPERIKVIQLSIADPPASK